MNIFCSYCQLKSVKFSDVHVVHHPVKHSRKAYITNTNFLYMGVWSSIKNHMTWPRLNNNKEVTHVHWQKPQKSWFVQEKYYMFSFFFWFLLCHFDEESRYMRGIIHHANLFSCWFCWGVNIWRFMQNLIPMIHYNNSPPGPTSINCLEQRKTEIGTFIHSILFPTIMAITTSQWSNTPLS